MRRGLAPLLLLLTLVCGACAGANEPMGRSRTPAVASSTAPKTLMTTSAASLDPAPGYRRSTTAEGITFAIPPGFDFVRNYGDGVLSNSQGASLVIGEAPLCGRPLTDLCNDGEPGWTREITASTCFETGRKGDTIEWTRSRVAGEAIYYLTFRYPASQRARFDDIVARVYHSWKLPDPPSDGGWCGPTLSPEVDKARSDDP